MASTYADNPPGSIRMFESLHSGYDLYYRDGVDYSGTADSQKDNLENVVRHAMRASAVSDNRTSHEAMMDGLRFGWNHIFAAGNSNFSSDMNSDFMCNFGVGMHALQDADVHQGATMDQHGLFSWSGPSMIASDELGPTNKTVQLSQTATIVVQILQGNFTNIRSGMTLNLIGMSTSQQNEIIKRLQDKGYMVNER